MIAGGERIKSNFFFPLQRILRRHNGLFHFVYTCNHLLVMERLAHGDA